MEDHQKPKMLPAELNQQDQAMTVVENQCKQFIESTLEAITNRQVSESTKAVIDAGTHLAANYAKAKLDAPAVENQKTLGEYYEKLASARKLNAEAESIEITNSIKKIELIEKAMSTYKNMQELRKSSVNFVIDEQPRLPAQSGEKCHDQKSTA